MLAKRMALLLTIFLALGAATAWAAGRLGQGGGTGGSGGPQGDDSGLGGSGGSQGRDGGLGGSGGSQGRKPRIAVLEFTSKAENQWYGWWRQSGAGAAQDVMVTELVKSRKFVVVEREKINAIMLEKGLTLSGDVDPKTAMQIGKLLGLNYLLTGSVTEYGNTDAGAHGAGFRGIPGFNAGKRKFVAALNARLINVSTGEIVWAEESRKEESSIKVDVGGFGGGVSDDRMFDKVMKPCIQELVASLKAADF